MSKNSASLSDIKPTKMGDTVYTVAGTLLRPLYNLPMKAQIEGREKLPKTGGFIVVSNHLTVVDPITAAYPLFLEGVLPGSWPKKRCLGYRCWAGSCASAPIFR